MTAEGELRFALIGCGAVVEQSHVAALRKTGTNVTLLVDPSPERRSAIAKALRAKPAEAARASDALNSFDAAIVAVPHRLHEPICNELLAAGKHVLVEKPMAASSASCAAMNAAAQKGRAKLAVGLMRRQAKASLWLKDALNAGAFGSLKRFIIREGYEYNWPLASDSMWRREQSGGGVLMDTGAHTMDQVVWWFGAPDDVEYFDDSDGGVEADCLIRMRWRSGLEGEIELSRTRRLSNQVTLFAEKGRMGIACLGNDSWGDPGTLDYMSPRAGKPAFATQTVPSLFVDQLKAFDAYAKGASANVVTGEEGARSVALIEKCYAVRQRLNLPWLAYSTRAA